MVANLEQYIFLHDALLEAVLCGETGVTAEELGEFSSFSIFVKMSQKFYKRKSSPRVKVDPNRLMCGLRFFHVELFCFLNISKVQSSLKIPISPSLRQSDHRLGRQRANSRRVRDVDRVDAAADD